VLEETRRELGPGCVCGFSEPGPQGGRIGVPQCTASLTYDAVGELGDALAAAINTADLFRERTVSAGLQAAAGQLDLRSPSNPDR
jgi:hypothetical protein